jgi:hypothetical protein
MSCWSTQALCTFTSRTDFWFVQIGFNLNLLLTENWFALPKAVAHALAETDSSSLGTFCFHHARARCSLSANA